MTRVAVNTGASRGTHFAGSTPGAPGKEWFLPPATVGEAVRFALRLPPEARVEEIVLRSAGPAPGL